MPIPVLRSPGEIAAVVPHLTGFVPHESLVAVSLRGRQVGLTVRVDLPDLAALQDEVVDGMVRDRASACLLVVFTEGPGMPHAADLERVEAALSARDVVVQEALLVRDGRWWSYRCVKRCCPPTGTPLGAASPAVQATASQAAYQGRAVLASREELVRSLAPAPPLGEAVARAAQGAALDALELRVAADRPGSVAVELARWRTALDAWEQRPGPVAPADVAALAAGLHLVPVRDAVVSWAADRHDALLALLGQLARAVVSPDDAPLCAVLAWVAYAQGNGALALVAVQRALGTDPGYSLASLLLAALDGLLPPAQVRQVLRQVA